MSPNEKVKRLRGWGTHMHKPAILCLTNRKGYFLRILVSAVVYRVFKSPILIVGTDGTQVLNQGSG